MATLACPELIFFECQTEGRRANVAVQVPTLLGTMLIYGKIETSGL